MCNKVIMGSLTFHTAIDFSAQWYLCALGKKKITTSSISQESLLVFKYYCCASSKPQRTVSYGNRSNRKCNHLVFLSAKCLFPLNLYRYSLAKAAFICMMTTESDVLPGP